MRDPFPVSAPAALQRLSQPLSDRFELTTLPLHVHELLFATAVYTAIQLYLSPWLSPRLFPRTYAKLNARSRLNWDVHVVSFIQSVLICALSLWVMARDEARAAMPWLERVHGYTPAVGMTAAFGAGYFVWDLAITTTYLSIFGVGMLAHAVSALTVFLLGFRPFLYYYCPTFLLYELSSPFLNIHWFLDKLDMTGSTAQLINGLFLLASFASCRLLWGTYHSVRVFMDVFRAWHHGPVSAAELAAAAVAATTAATATAAASPQQPRPDGQEVMLFAAGKAVPAWLALSYLASNVTLNALNWYWFGKMIATIRRRFDPPFGTRVPDPPLDGADGAAAVVAASDVQLARSVYADGHKGVEVSGTDVRHRQRRSTLTKEIEEEEEGEVIL